MSTPLPEQEKKYTTGEEVMALIDQAMRNFRYPTKVAGGFLQSQNFLSGTAGWRLSPDGTIEAWRFITGGTTISVPSNGNIQTAIDELADTGGTVELGAGTFNVSSHITVPSNINIVGQGAATIVDFGNNSAQFQVVGSNAYSTGTVSITRDTTAVVGAGGATFTSAMVGRFILLGELWYEITAFTDATHITIGVNFSGTTLSGATYVLATIVSGVSLSNFVIQNSAIALVKDQYTNASVYSHLIFSDGLVAIDGDDSSGLLTNFIFVQDCTTGVDFLNTEFCLMLQSTFVNVISGGAVVWNNVDNGFISVIAIQNCVGNGVTYTSCRNFGIAGASIKEITGKGIEFVSACRDAAYENCFIGFCSSDGIKLTATTDSIQMAAMQINNNSGWGINIAAATCDNNTIVGNTFESNVSGNITNTGTGTIIAGNSPNSVNTSTYNPGGTDVAVADGGTGASDASTARTNLGITIFDAETVSDQVGTMVTGNTETNITVTYQDADNTLDFAVPAADLTTAGVVEIATAAETTTGTDATRAVSPDGLSQSDFGKKACSIQVFAGTTSVATGDGKAYIVVPDGVGGMNLVGAHGYVVTAGTTNSTTVQIANVTQAADMLSALIEIESSELSSRTASPGVTIDTNNDDVADGDVLRIDVDTVSTTAPKGLIIELVFQLP